MKAEKIRYFFLRNFTITKTKLTSIRCFFFGHKLERGSYEWGEPDYCPYCWKHTGIWFITIPDILHNIYVWFVERDWKWFEKFDLWMIDRFGYRLPKWWEY